MSSHDKRRFHVRGVLALLGRRGQALLLASARFPRLADDAFDTACVWLYIKYAMMFWELEEYCARVVERADHLK